MVNLEGYVLPGLMPAPSLAQLTEPHPRVESKKAYQSRLEAAQFALLSLQQHFRAEGHRGVVVFEGLDAAGKGGVIKRFAEKLDPRGLRVHAIGAPNAAELREHYLSRFWRRLPEPGELAIFDRSWYGRVLVERAEKFTPAARWQQAYGEIFNFERMLNDDGVRIIKVFLSITKDEQRSRFLERLEGEFKHWKLTEADLETRKHWKAYQEAIEVMLSRTHAPYAPWMLIDADHKWYARVTALEACVAHLAGGDSLEPAKPDPDFIARARSALKAS